MLFRMPLSRAAVTASLTGALLLPASVVLAPSASASTQEEEAFGQRVVEEAARHDGKDYRYGATGPDSFDCSGYVQYVFRQVGRSIPRTSGEQYAASRKIDRSARRPGDLIAIHNSEGRVTHVGIYAGDDRMWIASTGNDRVMLQGFYTSRYRVGRFS